MNSFEKPFPNKKSKTFLKDFFWHFGISQSGVSRQDVRFRFLSTLGISGVRNETRHS